MPPKQLALHLENIELIRKLRLVRMLTCMLALLLSLMLQPDQQTLGQRVELGLASLTSATDERIKM